MNYYTTKQPIKTITQSTQKRISSIGQDASYTTNMKKKMKTKLIMALLGLAFITPATVQAQTKAQINGSVTLVTDYVWRGAYQQSGLSAQPSLTFAYGGLNINLWGNQSLNKEAKEFDINVSYAFHNFKLTVSDYWWAGVDQAYGHYKKDHYFEGTLAYTLSPSFPLSLTWSTMFAGADKNEHGHLQASTYINLSYPFTLPADITLTPALGFTPWEGLYYHKAGCTDISLTATKTFTLSERFSLPVFIQAIASPVYDRSYLVAGVSVGF